MFLMSDRIKIVPMLTRKGRFMIVDSISGKVLDNAHGSGFRCKESAQRRWDYIALNLNINTIVYSICKRIEEFVKSHQQVCDVIEERKQVCQNLGIPFTEKEVADVMAYNNIDIDSLSFTPRQFLEYFGEDIEKYNPQKFLWENMPNLSGLSVEDVKRGSRKSTLKYKDKKTEKVFFVDDDSDDSDNNKDSKDSSRYFKPKKRKQRKLKLVKTG